LEEKLFFLEAGGRLAEDPLHAHVHEALEGDAEEDLGLGPAELEQVEVLELGVDVEGIHAIFVAAPENLRDALLAGGFKFPLKVEKGEGVIGDDTRCLLEGKKDGVDIGLSDGNHALSSGEAIITKGFLGEGKRPEKTWKDGF
jgi:hypothetical protein